MRLAKGFDSGKGVLEPAPAHKRSRIAIEAGLVKREKIPAAPGATSRDPVEGPGGASGVCDSART